MKTVGSILPFDRRCGHIHPGVYVHFFDEHLSTGSLVKVCKPDGHYGYIDPNDLVNDDMLLVLEHRPGVYFHVLNLRTHQTDYLSGQDAKVGDDGHAYLFTVVSTLD